MMENKKQKIKAILLLLFSLFSLEIYGQQVEQLQAFSKLVSESDNLFLKTVTESYKDGELQGTDTLIYLKQGEKLYYKTKEIEYLLDTDVLMVDKSNELIVFQKYNKKAFAPINSMPVDTTSYGNFTIDQTCQCLKSESEEEGVKTSMSIYFNSDNTLQKMIYESSIGAESYRSVTNYAIFCVEKACMSLPFPSVTNYLIQKGTTWKVQPAYKNYILNIQ
ncbi:hypothetical protein [Bernardetia sp. MNP-M8]|uniref:hypothetical protein n=1 Tax=Bernardetia sp. MNP-M8 TaxID=3127470 RepID=UPI0030CC78D8